MFYGTIVAIHIQEEKGTNLEKINTPSLRFFLIVFLE
jgi:hypothetical protein